MQPMQPMQPLNSTPQPQWSGLRGLSTLFKVLAFVVGIVEIIAVFIDLSEATAASSSLFNTANAGPLYLAALTTFIQAIISIAVLYGSGEVILLLLTIEENTRKP